MYIKLEEVLKISINKKILLLGLIPIIALILGMVKQDESIDTESKYLVPLGHIVGIKANTDGVLVLGYDESNIEYIGGVEIGDNIVGIDGERIESSKEITQIINNKKEDNIDILIDRNGQRIKETIRVKREGDTYKLGLWVRDKISGIGTMTYYDPQDRSFGALGHAIKDADTNQLIKVKEGNIYSSKNIEIKKGNDIEVGKINGDFETSELVGNFSINDKFGINGNLTKYNNGESYKILQIGNENDIKVGPATIMFEDKNKKIKEYKIEIRKINTNNKENSKDMMIEVVDKGLLEYTGGIVQGMSGAPIIQNNKIVGAVTHVFVDNSKIGYGIFINKMIK